MDSFFVRANGRIKGPFTLPDLQKLVRKGLVKPEHEFSSDRASWVQIAQSPQFMPPGLRAATPPPTEPEHVAPAREAHPAARVMTIGRDTAGCDIVGDSLALSRRHFEVRVGADGNVMAADLGSTTGTYVNGRRLPGPRKLVAGDTVTAGGLQFKFDGRGLVSRPPDLGFEIRVSGLGRQVTDRGTGKPRMLIRDIDLALKPSEFIALVGASGAGKSTLFGALSGRVRATHGQVLYDAQDLYANFDAFGPSIGYVPQRDVFHDALPVADALRATSRLRLSKDTSAAEINANIDRVLKIVSLTEKRDTVISNLSGGEQKRVAIALELLSRPRILFLDEPTAPLDPRTTTRMMKLFRTLAEGGITVIMITHAANSLSECDMVAYMHKGLLTFFGPPNLIKEFFSVTDMGDAYNAEENKSPEEWLKTYHASPVCRELIASRQGPPVVTRGDGAGARPTKARRKKTGLAETWHQTKILTARYVRVLTIDRRSLAILILLAPAVAAMLCLVTSSIDVHTKIEPLLGMNRFKKQSMTCFSSVVIVMFLSLFASVREIVKELPIYLHEHFVNVGIVPYLLSKMIPLLLVGAVQTAMVVGMVNWIGGIESGTPLAQFGVLYLCSAVGTMLGLMISALVTQSDRAVTGMIGIVIPEILFSGAMIPVKGAAKMISGPLITAYWGFNAMMSMLPKSIPKPQEYIAAPKCCLVMFGHFAAATLLTYLLMVWKDASQLLERFLTQPAKKRKKPKRAAEEAVGL